MTRQNIGIGSSANDGTGDTLRQAGSKINANFTEVYALLGGGTDNLSTQITLENDAVVFEGSTSDFFETRLKATDATQDNIITLPDSTGVVTLDNAIQTLTNKTLTAPTIATIKNTGTLTLPTSTDTIVGRATTDTLTNKTIAGATLIHPKLGTTLEDSNGNEFIKFTKTASAVNEITITNNTTTNSPSIAASGNDANVNLSLNGKGKGSVLIAKAAFSSTEMGADGIADSATSYIIGNRGSLLSVELDDGNTIGEYKIFTNKGSGNMTVTPDNFAQGSSFTLATNDGCTCIWDGANWFLVGNQGEITVTP